CRSGGRPRRAPGRRSRAPRARVLRATCRAPSRRVYQFRGLLPGGRQPSMCELSNAQLGSDPVASAGGAGSTVFAFSPLAEVAALALPLFERSDFGRAVPLVWTARTRSVASGDAAVAGASA